MSEWTSGNEAVQARRVRLLSGCGLAGALLFTATWVIAGLAEPGFSFSHNDTSDLGALTAHHALAYNIGLSMSGLLTLGLAAALFIVLGRRWNVVLGAAIVAVFGIGQFIDGLAREDCAVSVNAACRAAEKAGQVSTHHKIHNAESLVTFTALWLAPLVLGLAFRSMPAWRGLAWWSIGAAVVELVSLPVFLAMYTAGSNGQGIVEIILVTTGVAWIATIAVSVLRRQATIP